MWRLAGSRRTIGFEQQRRLFEDGLFYHPDQKAKFLFEAPREMPEPPDKEYPFLLLTGRGTSSQWHTQTRTGKSAVLKKLYPDHVYVEMNPLDAELLGIEDQKVLAASRGAEVTATVFLTSTVQAGQLFIPMHYAAANELTFPAVDPCYGSCALARPKIFGLVESVLNFFNGQRYALGEHVVMPNHVHALVQPLDAHYLENILHSWKSFSAKQINKMSGSRGRVWHQESFDYIVRSPAQLARFEEYIRNNPNSLPLSERSEER